MAQDNWTHTDPDRGVQYTAADLTKTWPDPWAGSWTGSTTTTSSPVAGGTLYHNKNITNITGMPPRHDPAADPGTLCATDIKLQGLGSVKELLTQMEFLIPPTELDTDNSAVMDGLKSWYQALQELRHRHAQLKMLIKLTNETC